MSKLAITFGVISASVIGYAIYFDYERRHSVEFRRQLKKSKKQFEAGTKKRDEINKQEKVGLVRAQLLASLEAEPIPSDINEKQQSFQENIAKGEQLAAAPGKEIEAAICFYRTICLYPNPTELLSIYGKSLLPAVYDVIVMMVAILPPQSVLNILGDSGTLD